jgi:hypothetical protein
MFGVCNQIKKSSRFLTVRSPNYACGLSEIAARDHLVCKKKKKVFLLIYSLIHNLCCNGKAINAFCFV